MNLTSGISKELQGFLNAKSKNSCCFETEPQRTYRLFPCKEETEHHHHFLCLKQPCNMSPGLSALKLTSDFIHT